MPVKPSRRRARKSRTPESGVLAEVLQCLSHHRILCFRMNTGCHVATDAHGKQRFIKYGVRGMADVLAFPRYVTRFGPTVHDGAIQPTWIEAKSKDGRQSAEQKIFQQVVENDGHWYLLARSYEDVESFLRSKGVIR